MKELILYGDDGYNIKLNHGLLFKYCSIGDKLEKSILNNYLWFSDPLLDFNDPYDCNIEWGVDCCEEENYEFLSKKSKKENLGWSEAKLRQQAKYLFENLSERKMRSKEVDLKKVNNLGVCCFSKEDDILLMWSHYADKHRGVCLAFDVWKDSKVLAKLPYEVAYPPEYPIFNYPKDIYRVNSFRFLIATKSKDWEYEQEVRLVRDDKNTPFRGEVKFNKRALVAIKFGYKACPKGIERVNEFLLESGGYEHVKFYKAHIMRFDFGIYFKEIPRQP